MEITKDILYDLYIIKRKTGKEIARMFGYKSEQSIYNKLKEYNIKTRDNRNAQNPFSIEKERLINLYVTNCFSIYKISKMFFIGEETIRRLLILYGIKRRSKSLNLGGKNKGSHLSLKQKQNLSQKRIEYYKKNKHWNSGKNWDLKIRKKISKTLLNGREPAPNYYGDDWRIQRTSCLQRDNFSCVQCGDTENLEVHHWEPYRFSFDNSLENLVTLCRNCHNDIHKKYIADGFIKDAEKVFYEVI